MQTVSIHQRRGSTRWRITGSINDVRLVFSNGVRECQCASDAFAMVFSGWDHSGDDLRAPVLRHRPDVLYSPDRYVTSRKGFEFKCL